MNPADQVTDFVNDSSKTTISTALVMSPCHINCSSSKGANELVSSEEVDPYFRWVKVSIALIITVVILASNAINLLALYKMREIGLRMKVLLMSLSASDFCLGLFVCMPAVVSGILSRWPFGTAMCQITGIMNGVAISVSLWSLMAIGIERYLVMRKPRVSNYKKTSHVVAGCVAFIWSFNTLFFALPIFWEHDYLYYNYDPDVLTCSFMWKHTWHFLTAKFLYPGLSGTVIVLTSWQVNQVLKEAEKARKQWIINPVSMVGRLTKESEGQTPQSKPEPESKQKKRGETLERSLSFKPPNKKKKILTSDVDETRLSTFQKPLLIRDLASHNSPPVSAKVPFSCPSNGINTNVCLSIGENEKLETGMAGSIPDSNCEGTIQNKGHGYCLAVNANKETTPLSHNDFTVHLHDSSNTKPKIMNETSEGAPRTLSDNECGSNKPMIRKYSQQIDMLPSLISGDDARTNRESSQNKRLFFPFKLNGTKKTRKKEASFQGSVGLQESSGEPVRPKLRPLDAPMSKIFLRRQKKAKALLLCTTTVFFIAISPYSISSLLEHFIPNLYLPSWLRFFALWTLCTNCLLNVFIYSAVYTEFRDHCKQILRTVTCRGKKVQDFIVSLPTSSVFEMFVFKGKGKKEPSSQNLSNKNDDDDGIGNAAYEVTRKSQISLNPSAVEVPEIRTVPATPFEERSPQHEPKKPYNLNSLRYTTQVATQIESKHDRLNTIQVLPACPPRQTLQPRDDAGTVFTFPLTPQQLFSGSSTVPASPCSIGISPSISQSTRSSCSLDSFNMEMMPSIDV